MKLQQLAAISSLVLLLTGCSEAPTNDKPTWVNGSCTKAQVGVSLSIDFHGKVSTHCALGYKGNGWNLFTASGFQVRGAAKYPTAFACQINQEPKQAKCDGSDDPNAYWAYYVATNGKWDYATTGASDHLATCGESEGWLYMDSEKTTNHFPAPTEFACK